MMSFSNDVKRELCSIAPGDCCLRTELYAFIRYRANLIVDPPVTKIFFQTRIISLARRLIFLLRQTYDVQVELKIKRKKRPGARSYYVIEILDKSEIILRDYNFINDEYIVSEPILDLNSSCCKAALLRGAFMVKGSINNPFAKSYHLEITCPSKKDAKVLQKVLKEIGISAKIIERSKGIVLYMKKGENIADFLKFIGASTSLFAFEDVRIKKDLNNYVNRIMNCDVANEQKAIATAARQIENIKFLEENYGLVNLTPRLINAVVLRTTYPDDSFSQLSERSLETVGRHISKSGLSHCFKDLERLVEKIKKE